MSAAASLIGRTIAQRYSIEELVGGGAMGDVYRGKHIGLGSDVAIKILRPGIAEQANFKERFFREAKTASRLDHANSVKVLDFGQEEDGLGYIVMEFLRGRDLKRVLDAEWPLGDARIADILVQTLAAMSTAHTLGIVHRDLKPENIMIIPVEDTELVKVCDFGIAKLIDTRAYKSTDGVQTNLTTTDALIGTPEYMSPEQARGEPLDARSDLYSMGVILYLMLTKRLPFEGENVLGVAVKHIVEEPVAPSQHVPGVNPRLEAVCLRAMRKAPNERFATAKEMRSELRAAVGLVPTAATSVPEAMSAPPPDADVEIVPEVSSPPRSRSNWVVGAVAIGAMVIGGGAWAWTQSAPAGTEANVIPKEVPSAAPSARRQPAAARVTAARSAADAQAPRPPPGHPTAPVRATASGVTSAGTPPTPSEPRSAPQPLAIPLPLSTTSPGGPAPVTPPPAEAAPAPTPFKPSGALVSRESLVAERVRRDVVEQKLSELSPQLNECYRDALFITGSPVGGHAAIHLSIDPRGSVVAVVSAPQLPSFQRCVSRLFATVSIPTDAVDPGGGTAEQRLKLTP